MAKNNNLTDFLTDIANTIRTTDGTATTPLTDANKIDPQDFSTRIVNYQNKTVTPSASQQTITRDNGYMALGTVTVKANSEGPKATVTSGTTYSSVSKTITYDSTNTRYNVALSGTVSAPTVGTAGYISSSAGTKNSSTATGSTTLPVADLTATLTGSGTTTPVIQNKTASVSGKTQITASPSTSTSGISTYYMAVETPANHDSVEAYPQVSSAGYTDGEYYTSTSDTMTTGADASGTYYIPVASGTFKANNLTISNANPSLSIADSTGIVTGSVSKTGTTTSTSTAAGWIPNSTSGTSGTATISGSNTLQLTTKAAATYNTSTSDQKVDKYRWLTGDQTIKAVTTSNIDAANIKYNVNVKVGDANSAGRIKNVTGTFTSVVSTGQEKATSFQIASGYSAFVDGAEVTGGLNAISASSISIDSEGAETAIKTVTPSTSDQYINILGETYLPSISTIKVNAVNNVSGSIGLSNNTGGSATAAIANTDSMAVISSTSGKTAGTDYFRVKATATGTAGSVTPRYTVNTAGYIGSTVTGSATSVSVSSDTTGQTINVIKAPISTNVSLPSGSSSSGTINAGSYIKIEPGYNKNTLYYQAAAQTSLTGDAVEANVLSGKTFYSNSYTKKTGSMTNNGAISATKNPTFSGATASYSYTVPAGYHNGSGTVSGSVTMGGATLAVNSPSITPTISSTYTSGSGYAITGSATTTASVTGAGYAATTATASGTASISGYVAQNSFATGTAPSGTTPTNLSKNTVYKLSAGYYPTDRYYKTQADPTLSGNAAASNVLSGKTFYSNSYTKQTGSMTNNGTVTEYVGYGESYTIPQGYHDGTGTVSNSDEPGTIDVTDLTITPNALSGSWDATNNKYVVSQASKTATMQSTVTAAGYVSSTIGTKNTGTATVSAPSNLEIPKATFEVSGASVKTTSSGAGYIPASTTVGTVATGSVTPGAAYATLSSAGTSPTSVTSQYFKITPNTASFTAGYISSASSGTVQNYTVRSASSFSMTGSAVTDEVTVGTLSSGYYPISAKVKGTVAASTTGWFSSSGAVQASTATQVGKMAAATFAAQGADINCTSSGYTGTGTVGTIASGSATGNAGTITYVSHTQDSSNKKKFTVTGSVTAPAPTVSAGYVSSGTAGTATNRTVSLTITDAQAQAAVGAGSATTPATTITANPGSPTWNSSTSKYDISVSASQNVTPTVNAGYVSSGTVGTITVSGSSSLNQSTWSEVSSASSSTSLSYGKIYKLASGYYPSDRYYSVPAGPSGNIELTQATSTDVSTYATATVRGASGNNASAEGSVSISQTNCTLSSTNTSGIGISASASGVSTRYNVTTAGWISTGYKGATSGSLTMPTQYLTDAVVYGGSTLNSIHLVSSSNSLATLSNLIGEEMEGDENVKLTNINFSYANGYMSADTLKGTFKLGYVGSGSTPATLYLNWDDDPYDYKTKIVGKTVYVARGRQDWASLDVTDSDGNLRHGSATPSASYATLSSAGSSPTSVTSQYFKITPTASVGTEGWISYISNGTVQNYTVRSVSGSSGSNTMSNSNCTLSTSNTSGISVSASSGGYTVSTAGWIGTGTYGSASTGTKYITSVNVDSGKSLSIGNYGTLDISNNQTSQAVRGNININNDGSVITVITDGGYIGIQDVDVFGTDNDVAYYNKDSGTYGLYVASALDGPDYVNVTDSNYILRLCDLPTTKSSSSVGTSKATITQGTTTQYLNIPAGYHKTAEYYTISGLATQTLPSSTSTSSSGTSKATITPSNDVQYLNIPTGYQSTAQYYTIATIPAVKVSSTTTLTVGSSSYRYVWANVSGASAYTFKCQYTTSGNYQKSGTLTANTTTFVGDTYNSTTYRNSIFFVGGSFTTSSSIKLYFCSSSSTSSTTYSYTYTPTTTCYGVMFRIYRYSTTIFYIKAIEARTGAL